MKVDQVFDKLLRFVDEQLVEEEKLYFKALEKLGLGGEE